MRRSALARMGLFLTALILPSLLAASSEAEEKHRIRELKFLTEKTGAATRLAARGTTAARKALLELLADGDTWTRKAAVVGLCAWKDASVLPALLQVMDEQILLESDVRRGLSRNLATFGGELVKIFEQGGGGRDRRALFEILAAGGHDAILPCLERIVDGKRDELAPRALRAWARLRGRAGAGRLGAWLERSELRMAARTALVDLGRGWTPALRSLWKEALAARRSSERREIALRLGAMTDADAREAVDTLLGAADRSQRELGIVALGRMGRGAKDLERLLSFRGDHPFQTEAVEAALAGNMDRWFEPLRARCDGEPTGRGTVAAERIMAVSGDGKALAYLRGLAVRSDERGERVFSLLVETAPARIVDLARKRVAEKAFREKALACLVREGAAADLPVFRSIVDDDGAGEALFVLALEGVARHGDAARKEKAFLKAFRRSARCLRAALSLLAEAKSAAVADALAAAARGRKEQDLRMGATLLLARWKDPRAVALLVRALDETFVARKERLAPALFSAITLGLSAVGEYLGRRYDRRTFRKLRGEVIAALKKASGRNFGDDRDAWRRWALGEGILLDDGNLLQALFDNDPARRARAADGAARVLGHASLTAFAASDPQVAARRGLSLSLLLAERLVAAGYLKD